jgi:hypothetical protein
MGTARSGVAGFVPENLDTRLLTGVETVTNEENDKVSTVENFTADTFCGESAIACKLCFCECFQGSRPRERRRGRHGLRKAA